MDTVEPPSANPTRFFGNSGEHGRSTFRFEHPELAFESANLRGRLRRALLRLPERARVVVVLRDVYGWSHAQIAEALGISVSASKVRLHRARMRLRAILANSP